jgi:hypothetical protein
MSFLLGTIKSREKTLLDRRGAHGDLCALLEHCGKEWGTLMEKRPALAQALFTLGLATAGRTEMTYGPNGFQRTPIRLTEETEAQTLRPLEDLLAQEISSWEKEGGRIIKALGRAGREFSNLTQGHVKKGLRSYREQGTAADPAKADWQLREEEDAHHTLFEVEWISLYGVREGGPKRGEVVAKCKALEDRRRVRDPEGQLWNLDWMETEQSGQELPERLNELEVWGTEVLKTMRRAHASVECPGKWYDEWRPVEEKLDAITWELQTKLQTTKQTDREEEYLEDCGKKWVELLRQGERLYPIWPRQARDEAANALLTALDQSWTAENGSRERREWWQATKNWKKEAVAAIKRNLRTTMEAPRRSTEGGAPHEVLDSIVGAGEGHAQGLETKKEARVSMEEDGNEQNQLQSISGGEIRGRDGGGRYKCWDRGKSR